MVEKNNLHRVAFFGGVAIAIPFLSMIGGIRERALRPFKVGLLELPGATRPLTLSLICGALALYYLLKTEPLPEPDKTEERRLKEELERVTKELQEVTEELQEVKQQWKAALKRAEEKPAQPSPIPANGGQWQWEALKELKTERDTANKRVEELERTVKRVGDAVVKLTGETREAIELVGKEALMLESELEEAQKRIKELEAELQCALHDIEEYRKMVYQQAPQNALIITPRKIREMQGLLDTVKQMNDNHPLKTVPRQLSFSESSDEESHVDEENTTLFMPGWRYHIDEERGGYTSE
ncbi:MAG: hypothetical protein AB7F31_02720 [Parachlamydiales bacterium]